MQETITVALPGRIRPMLDEIEQRENISPSDLIVKAIEEYLFVRRFRLLRQKMVPQAQAQGVYTDQDVFDRVS